jgi:hypothetical protein
MSEEEDPIEEIEDEKNNTSDSTDTTVTPE